MSSASRQRNTLGELLREKVPRPEVRAPGFRVTQLDDRDHTALRAAIRFIGVGESIDDLRVFDHAEFVDALLSDSEPATTEPADNH